MLPQWDLVGIEAAALVAATLVVWLTHQRWTGRRDPFWAALHRIARRPALACAVAGLCGFAFSAAVSWIDPPPPAFHDEFSNLLAADTFAQGRITNPTHPFWPHFDSFHILHRPTYQSKYPPGPALTLALGQRLGDPLIGTWLTMGLAAAALCWMLQAWMPGRWALLGSLLPVVRLGVFGPDDFFVYWSRSYWGGALSMLGGALVYGAVPRILRRPNSKDALVFAAGLGILANTRPFEGLLVSVPAVVVLVAGALRGHGSITPWLWRVAVPGMAVLGLCAAAMAFYNSRVTGDPLRLPYQVYERTHGGGLGAFFTREPVADRPHDANPQMQRFYRGMDRLLPGRLDTLKSKLGMGADRARNYWAFYLGPALALPLLLNLSAVFRRPRMRLAAAVCALLGLEIFFLAWVFPHYPAPAAPLVFALAIQGLRDLRVWRISGRRIGRACVAAVLLICVASVGIAAGRFASRTEHRLKVFQYQRARVASHLDALPGQHLVMVRYDSDHRPHEEWVYNRADIDAAKIAWARELGTERDRTLRAHFPSHSIWLLHVQKAVAFLTRHPDR